MPPAEVAPSGVPVPLFIIDPPELGPAGAAGPPLVDWKFEGVGSLGIGIVGVADYANAADKLFMMAEMISVIL